jgi:hypothetical protein
MRSVLPFSRAVAFPSPLRLREHDLTMGAFLDGLALQLDLLDEYFRSGATIVLLDHDKYIEERLNEGLFYRDFTLVMIRDVETFRFPLFLRQTGRSAQHIGAKRWKEYLTQSAV